MTMKILIIGAGIGGLTAAVALKQAGFDVVVIEQAPMIREVGAAIMVSPNAAHILIALGLEKELAAVSVPVTTGEIQSWRGLILKSLDITAFSEKLGVPSTVIHRATLQSMLMEAFGAQNILVDHTCIGVDQQNNGAALAQFSNDCTIEADIIIGADGINSTVRHALHNDGPPRQSGYVCWRGLSEPFVHRDMPKGVLREIHGRGARFGICYYDPERLYWFATSNIAPSATASKDEHLSFIKELFEQWPLPVSEIINSTKSENIILNNISDRPPIFPWGIGNITLLGDAAHPMEPNLGQGACSAIEDGYVLAQILKQHTNTPQDGLRAYEKARFSRTQKLQKLSRQFGKVGQMSNPFACFMRETAMKFMPDSQLMKQQEQIWGYRP